MKFFTPNYSTYRVYPLSIIRLRHTWSGNGIYGLAQMPDPIWLFGDIFSLFCYFYISFTSIQYILKRVRVRLNYTFKPKGVGLSKLK